MVCNHSHGHVTRGSCVGRYALILLLLFIILRFLFAFFVLLAILLLLLLLLPFILEAFLRFRLAHAFCCRHTFSCDDARVDRSLRSAYKRCPRWPSRWP